MLLFSIFFFISTDQSINHNQSISSLNQSNNHQPTQIIMPAQPELDMTTVEFLLASHLNTDGPDFDRLAEYFEIEGTASQGAAARMLVVLILLSF